MPFWDTVNAWLGRTKKAEYPEDRLSQAGVYTIDSKDLRDRLEKFHALVEEYKNPINDADPLVRLQKWRSRLDATALSMRVIAVPYLRSMENPLYGEALRHYEKLFDYTYTFGHDLERILKKSDVANKDEIMVGYEFLCQNYIKTWAFTIINWSFGGEDIAPRFAITVQSMQPQRTGGDVESATQQL